MGIIYRFTNQINNKQYIGQSINPNNERYNSHKSSYKNENSCEYNSPLHRAFRKYGFENFTYEILVKDISDIDILNQLEIYYINQYNTLIPNGYNIEIGGKNAPKPKTLEWKEKLTWGQAELTLDEIKELRIAYKNGESPSKIYKEKYSERLHYNSFLNIWSGKRYKNIMPDYINKGRHTKMNQEIANEIRKRYKNEKISYNKLAEEYNCSKSAIADIIKNRTWNNV